MDFEKDEYVNISDSKNSGAHYTDISKKSPDLSTKKTTKRNKKTSKAILVTRIISGVLSLILIVAGVAMVYAENKYINNLFSGGGVKWFENVILISKIAEGCILLQLYLIVKKFY